MTSIRNYVNISSMPSWTCVKWKIWSTQAWWTPFCMIFAAKNKNVKWHGVQSALLMLWSDTHGQSHTHSQRHIGIVFFPLLFFWLFSHLVHAQWKYVLVSGSRAHTDVDCFSFRYKRRQRWRWRRRRRRPLRSSTNEHSDITSVQRKNLHSLLVANELSPRLYSLARAHKIVEHTAIQSFTLGQDEENFALRKIHIFSFRFRIQIGTKYLANSTDRWTFLFLSSFFLVSRFGFATHARLKQQQHLNNLRIPRIHYLFDTKY